VPTKMGPCPIAGTPRRSCDRAGDFWIEDLVSIFSSRRGSLGAGRDSQGRRVNLPPQAAWTARLPEDAPRRGVGVVGESPQLRQDTWAVTSRAAHDARGSTPTPMLEPASAWADMRGAGAQQARTRLQMGSSRDHTPPSQPVDDADEEAVATRWSSTGIRQGEGGTAGGRRGGAWSRSVSSRGAGFLTQSTPRTVRWPESGAGSRGQAFVGRIAPPPRVRLGDRRGRRRCP